MPPSEIYNKSGCLFGSHKRNCKVPEIKTGRSQFLLEICCFLFPFFFFFSEVLELDNDYVSHRSISLALRPSLGIGERFEIPRYKAFTSSGNAQGFSVCDYEYKTCFYSVSKPEAIATEEEPSPSHTRTA